MENKYYYKDNSSYKNNHSNSNQYYKQNNSFQTNNQDYSTFKNYNNYHNNPKKSYKNEYADSYDYDTQTKSNHLYNKFSGDNYNNKKNYNTENINYNNSCKDWLYRYSRNGYIRNEIIQEDEDLFKDHIEAMTKKKSMETNEIQKDCLVRFRGEEIKDKPMYTLFKEIKLDKQLQNNLEKMQFQQMTPIQRAVISFILQGNDVMGCAQTGSGKTIAFLLPIVNKMIAEGPPEIISTNKRPCSFPVSLILVPTRELAEQIYKESRKIISMTGVNVVKVYGGVPHDSQIRELKYGCDILVATPGRLLDFIESGLISLKAVKYLIIDEADRILDMGFEPQLNKIVFELDLKPKEQRQNLLFSATFSEDIKILAKKFMNEYYFISTYKDNNANANIKHVLMYSTYDQKYMKLHVILQQIQGSVIIFLDTKKGVDNLSNFLNKANYNTIAIHGDKTQIKRLEAIEMFTRGDVPILIATDVASRGLDFPSVSYVFNFELPTNIEDYVHRIGRTGRLGNTGIAISFINEGDKPIIKDMYLLMKKLNQEIPNWFENMYSNVKDYKPSSNYYNHNNSNRSNYNKFNNRQSERNTVKNSYSNRKEKSPINDNNDEIFGKKPVFFNNSKGENDKKNNHFHNNQGNSNYNNKFEYF